jgi:hypothetical protein
MEDKMLDVSSLGKIGVTKTDSITLPWGKGATPGDPFVESQIRSIISADEFIATSRAAQDNTKVDDWGKDLDPDKGRVLVKHEPVSVPDLKGGTVNPALSVTFEGPANHPVPLSLDVSSEDKNLTKHASWDHGVFQGALDERVLKDGSREVMVLHTDEAKGTITMTTCLWAPGQK